MILNIETTGFSHDADLFLIGVRTRTNEIKIWKRWDFPSEESMLKNFLSYFLGVDDKIVIGFNILKFELPYLFIKVQKLPEFRDFFKKINLANVVDLYTILTFMNKGVIKGLSFYCEKYKLKEPPQDREILRSYESRDYEKASRLAEEKLNSINSLFSVVWSKARKGQYG
jgi:DNA polymerase elongation subunit (family B)